jgi:hypothetical protein
MHPCLDIFIFIFHQTFHIFKIQMQKYKISLKLSSKYNLQRGFWDMMLPTYVIKLSFSDLIRNQKWIFFKITL